MPERSQQRSDHGSGPARRLGALLIARGLLTAPQLDDALQQQRQQHDGQPLDRVLVKLGMVEEGEITAALADSVNLPFLHLNAELVQKTTLDCLPSDYLEKHNLLPLAITGNCLTIAIERFTNIFLIEDIARRTGFEVHAVAATADNIRSVRETLLRDRPTQTLTDVEADQRDSSDGLRNLLAQIDVDDLKVVESDQRLDEADLVADATDSPVVKLVNYIIKTAVEMHASDIHIEPEDSMFRVRYRVDGELLDSVRPSSQLLPAVVSRIKIMASMDISERRLPQDGGMTVTLGERPIDLRVSTMATKIGEKVVLRILDRGAKVRDLGSLGLSPDVHAKFRTAVTSPFGMVLVTGPTGSGKSTTLYAALAEIMSSRRNISTIEDPVEVRLRGANQFQVQPQSGFTFARALRSLLRQDPDIVMVGEIRDTETAKLVTEAALTGHLVLSTLHTNDAPTAIPRLVNMGVEPYLVAASLRSVLAQRLVRKLCPHCRKQAELSSVDRTLLASLFEGKCPVTSHFESAGCSRCRNLGYVGRVGIFELLDLDEDILTAVTHDPSIRALRAAARASKMKTLLTDGLEKVAAGSISATDLLEIVCRFTIAGSDDITPNALAA